MIQRCSVVLCLLANWLIQSTATFGLQAADWPQFQGLRGDGSSPETGLIKAWPKDGPTVVWRQKIKPGWGSPSVVGDDVYLGWTEQRRGDEETIACLNASTGDIRWKHTYPVGPYWERNIGWGPGGYRSTPCVSGDRVFGLGAVGHLLCLDRHSGHEQWSVNLWEELNPSGEKGYVFSPIVVDGKLILWYGDGVSLAKEPPLDPEKDFAKRLVVCRALDPANGKLLWELRQGHRPQSRCGEGQTPAVVRLGEANCIVVTANAELKAIRASDGKEIWKFACPEPRMRGTTIPTPLAAGNYLINIPDADPAHAVEWDPANLDKPARMAWKNDVGMYCPIHQFRHHEGYLYGFSGEIKGGSEKDASDSELNLICLELASGKRLWHKPGFKTGVALTLADGMLFVRSYQTLQLIEASPKGYQLHGTVKTHDVWKPTLNLLDFVQPVLSQGKLFIRTPDELICYQVGQ